MTQTEIFIQTPCGMVVLVPDIPKGAKGIDIYYLEEIKQYFLIYNGRFQKPLPPGHQYEIIGLCPDIPEEVAVTLVDRMYLGEKPTDKFENYGFGLPKYDNPVLSLCSRVRAEGYEPGTTLILKIN